MPHHHNNEMDNRDKNNELVFKKQKDINLKMLINSKSRELIQRY